MFATHSAYKPARVSENEKRHGEQAEARPSGRREDPGQSNRPPSAYLECRKALHIELFANVFAAWSCAVHVACHLGGVVRESIHQLVPIGLHRFAVPSPRCEELDENRPANGFLLPVVRGKLSCASSGDERERGE